MMPSVVARYRILQPLGAGGMGEVYLAEDPALQRHVAIKVLPAPSASDETARARLLREARAAARIDHPNVCAIYEVGSHEGRDFFVMQHVDGQTLAQRMAQGPVPVDQILAIAAQSASALAAAHAHGIVHRDIKPQNVMLDVRGQAKVMDFGLAKVVAASQVASGADTVAELTEAGLMPGTTAYMSPEQLRAEPLDPRSDLFSFGCVLHEMLSQRHPFKRESVAETIAAVLSEPPPRLNASVPVEIQRIVGKCLEKEKDQRYQTANDLLVDVENLRRETASGSRPVPIARLRHRSVPVLAIAVTLIAAGAGIIGWRQWQAPGPSGPPSIRALAVLPFVSTESETEYLGDGISENLINSLSQLPQLKVMARATTFRYRGQGVDVGVIRRELGVDAVVSGRVAQQGGSLVVQADLANAIDGTAIWGARYNRQLVDVFAVQEEIAREITSNLRLHLTGREAARLAKRYTSNVSAYRSYLLGRQFAQRRIVTDLQKAVDQYQQAIAEDSRFALAFAGLTDAYLNLSARGAIAAMDGRTKAQEAARTALSLDPDLAEAHAAVGQLHVYVAPYDFRSGDQALRRAIELSPGWAIAYQYLGLSLHQQGKLDEGRVMWEKAFELDPLSPIVNRLLAYSHFLKRDFARAMTLQRAANRLGDPFALYPEFEIYLANGQASEALTEIERLTPGREQDPYLLYGRALVAGTQGRREEAARIAHQLDPGAPAASAFTHLSARIHVVLNDHEHALGRLERALDAGTISTFYKDSPFWDPVRSTERFSNLLRRMGVS